jgi:hypothetical protein
MFHSPPQMSIKEVNCDMPCRDKLGSFRTKQDGWLQFQQLLEAEGQV